MTTITQPPETAVPEELVQIDPQIEDAQGWILVPPGMWSPGPRALAAFVDYTSANKVKVEHELRQLQEQLNEVKQKLR